MKTDYTALNSLDTAMIERQAQQLRARAVAEAFGSMMRALRNGFAALPRALRAPRTA